jgi:hypothetical protein
MCSEKQSTKVCTKCKAEKPNTDQFFYNRKDNRYNNYYLSSWCKSCSNKKDRENHLIRKYGLDGIALEQMLIKQQHRCHICERKFSLKESHARMHIDHCHTTGKVRGVLCAGCNIGLGHFKDNPVVLRRAAQYLCEDIV